MFIPVSKSERDEFLKQNNSSFIPGYTGYCPQLKFQYGKPYGAETKTIIRDLRDKGVLREVLRERYRETDASAKVLLEPIVRNEKTKDYTLSYKYRMPRYMIGYTGFIPMLNFRYGKSYGKTAEDCMTEFETNRRKLDEPTSEAEIILRTRSAPKLIPIRGKDEVLDTIKKFEYNYKGFGSEISENCPPIAGYTGHIPRAKGTEESLSQRYHNVVKRGFALLNEERKKRNELIAAQKQITSILRNARGQYTVEEV